MTTKTKTPSTKKATAKKVVKKPAAKAPRKTRAQTELQRRSALLSDYFQSVSHLTIAIGEAEKRIMAELSLIRSGMEFSKDAKQDLATLETDMSLKPIMDEIQLEPVLGSTYCLYSVIEQRLAILYKNQEKLLQAIKLLGNRS